MTIDAEDDDFTDEERESKELEEFCDVWKQSGLHHFMLLHRDIKEALEEHDEPVCEMLLAALEVMNLRLLLEKPQLRYLECNEAAFPIWRKWHKRPS